MIFLTLPELIRVAERVLDGDVKVRDYGLLESALARPRTTAFGRDAYPTLDGKAAALLHRWPATTLSLMETSDWPWRA